MHWTVFDDAENIFGYLRAPRVVEIIVTCFGHDLVSISPVLIQFDEKNKHIGLDLYTGTYCGEMVW